VYDKVIVTGVRRQRRATQERRAVQRSRTRWSWRTSHTGPSCSVDGERYGAVPWARKLAAASSLFLLLLLSSSCSVLVESEAFRTLTAPTESPLASTSHASPSPSDPSQGATPAVPEGEAAPVPATWLRDLAWEHLVQAGIAGGAGNPVWDDSCGPASHCWGAWRLELRRLQADAETDRFGVRAVSVEGIVVEMVVASDAVVSTQALSTATPEPTRRPGPSTTPAAGGGLYVVTLHSLPPQSPYDDMVRIWNGALGQMGVRGADETLEQALEALRDTGRLVVVEAWLEDAVADYGDARLLVERIVAEVSLPEPRDGDGLVEGWVGTVVPLPAAATYDDYFDSWWPGGQYGIAADDAALAEALVGLRDSGEAVRIWGVLRGNESDYGQVQIVVSRIELADLDRVGD